MYGIAVIKGEMTDDSFRCIGQYFPQIHLADHRAIQKIHSDRIFSANRLRFLQRGEQKCLVAHIAENNFSTCIGKTELTSEMRIDFFNKTIGRVGILELRDDLVSLGLVIYTGRRQFDNPPAIRLQ